MTSATVPETPFVRWPERFAYASVLAALVFTVLKGLVTRPHDWALTQLHFNYRHGLVRRGLVGQLLEVFHAGKRPPVVFELDCSLSGVLLIAWLLLLVREIRSRLSVQPLRSSLGMLRLAAVLLFVSSPAIWNLAVCSGYLDPILLMLGLGMVACRSKHFVVACFLAAIAIFVHEMAGLLLAPLLLFFAFEPTARWGVTWRRAVTAAVALAVLGGLTLFMARRFPSQALERELLERKWTPDHWVHQVCDLLRLRNEVTFDKFRDAHAMARFRANGALCFPASFALMAAGILRLRGANISKGATWIGALMLAVASWSVLVVNLVAFDQTRIFALANLQAFLAFCMRDRKLEGIDGAPRPWTMNVFVPVTLVVLVLGLLTPMRFTYLPQMARWVPPSFDARLWDPLGKLGEKIGTFK